MHSFLAIIDKTLFSFLKMKKKKEKVEGEEEGLGNTYYVSGTFLG